MLNNNHIGYLHFWCQKVLPLVYDNSLSYLETLYKLKEKLNEVIKFTNDIPEYIDKKFIEAFDEEHLKELISEVFRTIEDAISANNEGTNTHFSTNYPNAGTLVWHDNKLYKTKHPIDAGDTVLPNSNIELVNFGDMFNEFLNEVKTRFTDNDDGDRETSSADRPIHDLVWLHNELYEVIKPIAEGNAYIYSGVNKNVETTNLDKIYDYLLDLISSEIETRAEADIDLQHNIDAEATAREEADGVLGGKITNEIAAREQAVRDEATAREQADNNIIADLGNEVIAREQADSILEGKILSAGMKPLDVTLHGVVGDGLTNNTAAFQQILLDYPNYAYYFPKGTYLMGGDKFKGNINLVGDGDATIVDFIYEDLEFPILNRSEEFQPNQPFLSAINLKFTNTSGNYGLTMHVQSQGSVMRCFDIRNCTFYGDYGAQFINCITGNISSCDFIKNVIGISFKSSTNITVVECNWYSPVKGILIGTSSDDTAGRKGGESIMLTGCQMIDGVTAIEANRHNYLQLNNCMIDYFNLGVWLDSSRFCRMVNTYIGCDGGNKAGMHGYMGPNNYGCVFGYSTVQGVPFTFEAINSEFAAYGDVTHIPVVMNGGGATRGEDIDFISCRFTLIHTVNAPCALYVTNCDDVLIDGNRFYAPNNDNLEHPYVYSNSTRVIISNNDYVNCFKSNSSHVVPDKYNNFSNKTYQEVHVVEIPTDGTSQSATVTVNFNSIYDSAPVIIAMLESGGTDYYKCILSIHTRTTSSVKLNLYRPDANLSGTYKAHILVMHDMY